MRQRSCSKQRVQQMEKRLASNRGRRRQRGSVCGRAAPRANRGRLGRRPANAAAIWQGKRPGEGGRQAGTGMREGKRGTSSRGEQGTSSNTRSSGSKGKHTPR